jgi:hypothetical protein
MGGASRDRIVATLANNRVMLADHINGQSGKRRLD